MTMLCPKCKSTDVISIAYGYPGEALWNEAEAGKIKLGGCVIKGPAPAERYCKDCGHEFLMEKVKRRGIKKSRET
jgi:hypothetical protein